MTSTVQTQKMFFAMGTVNTITVFEEADAALSAAKDCVKELDRKLSAYSHDSEIGAVNRMGRHIPCGSFKGYIQTYKAFSHVFTAHWRML